MLQNYSSRISSCSLLVAGHLSCRHLATLLLTFVLCILHFLFMQSCRPLFLQKQLGGGLTWIGWVGEHTMFPRVGGWGNTAGSLLSPTPSAIPFFSYCLCRNVPPFPACDYGLQAFLAAFLSRKCAACMGLGGQEAWEILRNQIYLKDFGMNQRFKNSVSDLHSLPTVR